jgi:hypothetical protein
MTLGTIWIFAGAMVIVSCSTNGDKVGSTSDASGIYVREYTVEINNPETGKKIGVRQVRDSIFVERGENGYQVSNRKWRMNDYDQEGWVSLAHAEDRPLPTFLASYDDQLGALTSENSGGMQPIFIENGRLFKDGNKEVSYQKVE